MNQCRIEIKAGGQRAPAASALAPGAGASVARMQIVRDARAEDAAAIAEVHVRAWQAAYRGLMPEDFLID